MSGYHHSPKEQNYKLEITRDVVILLHTDKEKKTCRQRPLELVVEGFGPRLTLMGLGPYLNGFISIRFFFATRHI